MTAIDADANVAKAIVKSVLRAHARVVRCICILNGAFYLSHLTNGLPFGRVPILLPKPLFRLLS